MYVSQFSPRRGSRRPGFADVGPKVLPKYYYHSYGAQFLCWCLSFWGKTAKAPPTRGEWWPNVLRACKTPIFLKTKS